MDSALVVGGTRFLGRAIVETFRDAGYDVTTLNRGEHDDPFADDPGVDRVEGDRTNDSTLERARDAVDPDAVIDCVAYFPRDVRSATRIFADADAYVYVSSGAAYGAEEVPKREDETPLHACSEEQATDESMESYGPRKAEGDRAVFEAAERGLRATSLRPPVIYGPHDYYGRFDYWIDRVLNHDRIVVPYTDLWHLAFVRDVARAARVLVEDGEAGRAYNVGDHTLPTLPEWVDLIADAADTEVETVRAGPRELGVADLAPDDFPLYRSYPHVLDTHRLEALGWTATPHREAVRETVAEHREADRTGREEGPDREAEERILSVLDTM